ncbi:DUF262 domain-containing protein [Frankia sp. AgB32]|uniref:GmrSD restriction endonuclease domain-containing protein n=1 Tax=Frankia sp. AgB32 TaxID=631119 RepID=UPI00200DCD15|nr:DUF262 domain-containing protein [Frankia sp. AgB32]
MTAIVEHDGNTPLDVEEEQDSDLQDIDRPWNPESIRVSTKSFSLRNMLDSIDEESLDLAPDFQRLRVWKPVQKAQLIESVLLQIPLPAFYFAEDIDGTLRVIDGVQRLSTIHDFVRGGPKGSGGFPLVGVEYLTDVVGKRFGDLPALWRRRLNNTQIVVNVIDPSTPRPVMYDIFRRINTGGTPLNAQEIRHCMSDRRSRDFLRGLTEVPEFAIATGGALERQRRMIDHEVALRFCAFWLMGEQDYVPPMDRFLQRATEMLDDPRQVPDALLREIEKKFIIGLRTSIETFGDRAFRKWPLGDDRRNPFNRALFESWSVELARSGPVEARDAIAKIQRGARLAMRDQPEYIAAVTASTGDGMRVRNRFLMTRSIIESAR